MRQPSDNHTIRSWLSRVEQLEIDEIGNVGEEDPIRVSVREGSAFHGALSLASLTSSSTSGQARESRSQDTPSTKRDVLVRDCRPSVGRGAKAQSDDRSVQGGAAALHDAGDHSKEDLKDGSSTANSSHSSHCNSFTTNANNSSDDPRLNWFHPQTSYYSSSSSLQRQRQRQMQRSLEIMDERKEDELRENMQSQQRRRLHEWDADADFPDMELRRIRNKTQKLRNAKNNHRNNSKNNSDDNEAFFLDLPPESEEIGVDRFPETPTGGGQSARQERRKLWSNSSRSTSSNDNQYSKGSKQEAAPTQAAAKAQKKMLQDFHRPRAFSRDTTTQNNSSTNAVDSRLLRATNNSSDPSSTVNTTHTSNTTNTEDPDLQLHDLCGEATTPDDIAWRNALYLLSREPTLAQSLDPTTRWTPLHICCLGESPPPSYMLRALLYVHPWAAAMPDDGGRLPLHLVAASSACPTTLQCLVQEYPAAVYHRDDVGLTPLHLLLRNRAVPCTLVRCHILLGVTTTTASSNTATTTTTTATTAIKDKSNPPHVLLQRKRQHLSLSIEELEAYRRRSHVPVTTNLLNHNDLAHEQQFATYSQDVQVALRQLTQWKYRQRRQQQQQQQNASSDEGIEVAFLRTTRNVDDREHPDNHHLSSTNHPASVPFPGPSRQLPIHMLIQRAFIDQAVLQSHSDNDEDYDDDDADEEEEEEYDGEMKDNNWETTEDRSRRSSEVRRQSSKNNQTSANGIEVPSNSRDENDDDWQGNNSNAEDDEDEIMSIRHRRSSGSNDFGNNSGHTERAKPSVPHAISILRLFAAIYPEGLTVRDGRGRTPLLQVLTDERAPLPDVQVVEILLGTHLHGLNPQQQQQQLPPWAAELPVHQLLRESEGNNDNIHRHHYVNAAMLAIPETGQLPLHVAAEEMASDASVVEAIRQAYPGAVQVVDHRGRTPLHLALRNYRRIPVPSATLHSLWSDRIAGIRDDYGQLPLDLLVDVAPQLLPRSPTVGSIGDTDTIDHGPNGVYRRLVRASLVGSASPTTPSERSTLLRRLRTLPPWLRRDACSTTLVQELLVNDFLANPWVCASILCDGVLLVALTTVFRQQMKEFVDQLDSAVMLSTWYTYAVYATAILRLCGRFMEGGLAMKLGEFRHLCIYSFGYCLDVWAMLFTVVTSAFLYGPVSDERLLQMGTASTCLLWATLVWYLSNWWHGMAVFTGGFVQIAYRMVSPLICAVFLVVASSQCFFTLLQLECSDAMGIAPVCSVRDSYRIAFMLLRGDPFLDPSGDATLSTPAIVMVATILVLFVIFMLSLLVTVLISALRLDFDEIALGSYWEPKLAFVLFAEDLGLSLPTVANSDESHHYSFAAKQARVWDVYMQTLQGGQPEKGSNWFARPMQSTVVTWITAVFVVPIWCLLGLGTLGLLWPPQLRRWLFRPAWRPSEKGRSSSWTATEQSEPQLLTIRDDILQLKMMAYEKSITIEDELKEIKKMMRSAMHN